MKNFIALIIFFAFVAGAVIAYRTPFSFCDIPITYKLGTIDPRFSLKQPDALKNIEKAANILSSSYGKNLFDHSPTSGEITINFVYDSRTALDSNISKQEAVIDKQDAALNAKIKSYEAEVKTFQQKMEDLNSTIRKYNSIGGAPPEIYADLINRQNQLIAEGNALNDKAEDLNLETNNFNSQVQKLNQNVSEFNRALEQKPEEGLYDGFTKTILIYFVKSEEELVHTLTHEFGHALGMEHVDNFKAIMYPLSSQYLVMTDEDKKELDRVCQSFPLPEYWVYQLRQYLAAYLNPTTANN